MTTGGPQGRIAVIVEPARPLTIAPLLVEAYGLTGREAEVLYCLLQGLSTKEIAGTLRVSPYTVQEHCSALFDKIGVRSRREIIGKVFYQHYRPRSRRGAAIGPTGWFANAARGPAERDEPAVK